MSKKPVPSKKQCPSSTGSRSSKWQAEQRKKLANKYATDTCPETGEAKLRHFASTEGRYKGRQVFKAKQVAAPVQEI